MNSDQFCSKWQNSSLCLSTKNRLYSSNVKHYFCYSEQNVSCAWNWTLNDCFCFCIGQILPSTVTKVSIISDHYLLTCRSLFLAKLSSQRAKRGKKKKYVWHKIYLKLQCVTSVPPSLSCQKYYIYIFFFMSVIIHDCSVTSLFLSVTCWFRSQTLKSHNNS